MKSDSFRSYATFEEWWEATQINASEPTYGPCLQIDENDPETATQCAKAAWDAGRASRDAEVEGLAQLLFHWHWLWREGEVTFEPFQWTQEGFDDLLQETYDAWHKRD